MQSLAAALYVLACLAAPAAAQEEPAIFRSDSRLVVLHATVFDAHGELITNLPQSAFHVFENGVEQELKIFRREDAPVSIGLIIDDSGSMTNKRRQVAAAALSLIKSSHPDDEVFVLHFNEKSYLDTDFTNDTRRLEEGLATFDTQGATAMRDAVRLAIEHMERKAREDKKVLLVVSDGEDNMSLVDRDFVVRSAQQSGVLVYAIGLLNEEQPDSAAKAAKELDALTRATGGQAYFLNDASEAERTTRAIAHDIRNQYTLAYSPSEERLDGTYRRIRVAVDAPAPLFVRTRAGYYATPQTSAQAAPPAADRRR
jgi:Ca-activated chloride channel family protein